MIKIEMTDTFGGEANYSWVNKMTIDDSDLSLRAILKKVREEFELGSVKLKKVCDTGDMVRYNLIGACICLFITWEY